MYVSLTFALCGAGCPVEAFLTDALLQIAAARSVGAAVVRARETLRGGRDVRTVLVQGALCENTGPEITYQKQC